MNKVVILIAFGGLFFSCNNQDTISNSKPQLVEKFADVEVNTDSESEKFSYSFGSLLAENFKESEMDSIDLALIDQMFNSTEEDRLMYMELAKQVQALAEEEVDIQSVNLDVMKRAMYDKLNNDTSMLSVVEMQNAINSFFESNNIRIGDLNLTAGKKFLEANKVKEGINTTDTGLQHQLIEQGTGAALADDDIVSVEVVIKNIDGDELFTTEGSQGPVYVNMAGPDPYSLAYTNAGLVEGLKLYPMGSHFRLFVPANLAFGEQRVFPEMGPQSTMIYEVKSIDKLDNATKAEYKRSVGEYMKQLQQMQQQQGR